MTTLPTPDPSPAPAPSSSPDFARFAAALAGQYELECEIGRGGMGVVYRARDVKLDRRVAIKTLPPHLASDPVVRELFLREARTAGKLSHQNIVPIHRADELQGRVFFVMGFVDGESVAQRIRDQGRIDPREVVGELRDVAAALGYAHAHGVIHRDVKAENFLIERASGRTLVTDFGIARLAEAAPLTATGQLLGTVYYLSPEQVSGDPVDARSDIYSLGVAGYFALSGRFPFDAALASAVLIAHVIKTPPPLHTVAGDVPRALTDLIDRCLAKDPAERFQTCDELLNALASIEGRVRTEMGGREWTGSPPPRQPLLSDTEAQEIWSRAADLQALTGIEPRPAPLVGRRDSTKDAARTSGYRAGDVRDAAVEAGISAKYVDHVFEEHGLTPTSPLAERPLALVDKSKPESLLAGGHTHLEYEVVVDGEMSERDYDLLADIIRHETSESGQVAALGRSFTWQTHPAKRNLQVSVLSRGGKTTIRVSETMKAIAGALFGGIMGGLGGGSMGVWIVLGARMHDPLFTLLGWAGTVALSFLTARGFFGMATRKRQRELEALAEQLAAQARESIVAARQQLAPPDAPRLRG